MSKRATNRKDGKASEGYAREPNGQLSRKQADMNKRAFAQYDQQERETMETALAARERVYGLPRAKEGPKGQPVAVSRDPMAGSFIGRLCLQGEITITQYDALVKWVEQYDLYAMVNGFPRPPGAARLTDSPRGGKVSNQESVDFTRQTTKEFIDAKNVVMAAQQEPSNQVGARFLFLGALWHCVEQDMERRDMVPTLRTVANLLARHYKLTAKQREAA